MNPFQRTERHVPPGSACHHSHACYRIKLARLSTDTPALSAAPSCPSGTFRVSEACNAVPPPRESEMGAPVRSKWKH